MLEEKEEGCEISQLVWYRFCLFFLLPHHSASVLMSEEEEEVSETFILSSIRREEEVEVGEASTSVSHHSLFFLL